MKSTRLIRRTLVVTIAIAFLIITKATMAMKLTSTSFKDGGILPEKYTCDGEGISPQIAWHDAPAETKSFVLIYDDPDAPSGTWVHWVLYNLPATANLLTENEKSLPKGTQIGLNSWPRTGYGAPCPPSGEHRYILHLYALNTVLDLPEQASSSQVYNAMEGHILEEATLTGRYKRK
jgi:hypothetical protein